MYIIITILAIVAGVLLGAIVLIQNPKGGGLNASMGGVGQQILGARRSTDVVEKATWGLAGALLFFSLATTFFIDKKTVGKESTTTELEEMVKKQPATFAPQQNAQPAIEAQKPAEPAPANP